ncbi:hypothetical protein SK128_002523 [Halocaridina rubra]|uniref:Uncharacterized protein n=1 Tax=Halocaridina rubra TaxID=373956 RepID=A0AAN8ZV14_HALRR
MSIEMNHQLSRELSDNYFTVIIRVLAPLFVVCLLTIAASLFCICRYQRKKNKSPSRVSGNANPYFLASPESFSSNQASFQSKIHVEAQDSMTSIIIEQNSNNNFPSSFRKPEKPVIRTCSQMPRSKTDRRHFYNLNVQPQEITSVKIALRRTFDARKSLRRALTDAYTLPCNTSAPVHGYGNIRVKERLPAENNNRSWQMKMNPTQNSALRDIRSTSSRTQPVEFCDVLSLCNNN